MKKATTFVVLSLLSAPALCQQDPLYSQYLNNPLLINPAFTGLNNRFNAVAGYRTQWAGFDGSPTTLNFTSHLSFFENKAGVGIQVVQDKIGDNNNTEISASYSYKLVFSESALSFGLQTGVMNFRNDLGSINPRDQNDPAFGLVNQAKFNVGGGLIFSGDRFLVGLSAPRLLPTTVESGGRELEVYHQHYYLTGSYVAYLSETVRLKPSVLVRATRGAPVTADVNFNVNLEQHYTVGIFTRSLNTYGLLMQMSVKEYRFGYVFEVPTSKSIGQNFNSHEITLSVSIGLLKIHDRQYSEF